MRVQLLLAILWEIQPVRRRYVPKTKQCSETVFYYYECSYEITYDIFINLVCPVILATSKCAKANTYAIELKFSR